MKKISLFIIFTLLLQGQPTTVESRETLDSIIEVALEEGFTLEEWEVVMIDEISTKDFKKITNILGNSYLVTTIKDDNTIKYIFEVKNQDSYVNHYFQAIVPNSKRDRVSFHTVLYGDKWDDSIRNYYNYLTKNIQSELTINFDKIFTCVKMNDNGIIIGGFYINDIWKKLKVVHKFEQEDNIDQSVYEKEVYGYTPMWNSKLTVQEQEINFHMIIKNDEQNNKQVIIGTPIIINEY